MLLANEETAAGEHAALLLLQLVVVVVAAMPLPAVLSIVPPILHTVY